MPYHKHKRKERKKTKHELITFSWNAIFVHTWLSYNQKIETSSVL